MKSTLKNALSIRTPSKEEARSAPDSIQNGNHNGSQNVRRLPLERMLVDSGLITHAQANEALETAHREDLTPQQVLIRDGILKSKDIATMLALELAIPMVDLGSQSIESAALVTITEDIARKYQVLPIKREGNRLTVALADPLDFRLIEDISTLTDTRLQPVIATPEDISENIEIAYRRTQDLAEVSSDADEEEDVAVTAKVLSDSPPAQVIDLLLRRAAHDRASDIHIEPTEQRLRVRFRIDGILHDVMNLSLEMHPTLLSRLKIISGMNIAERRRAQDGQFTAEIENRKIDVRVAISNTVTGEMAVLRLLDKGFTLLGLGQIGMEKETLARFRKLLRLPYGIIIVCGPTGAGKSTTLYAAILEMNRVERNVISLEDPVEYRIPDINQMQIQPEAGVTFASQLRSTLRLDPDVILVGEIRDQETAIIATQAALTGHLVLTSLHANDAVSAVMRLRDLGVAPYLLTSSLAGVVSQRMMRVVCQGCKSVSPPPETDRNAYEAETGEELELYTHGVGCNVCAQTGYRGRSGVFEVLKITDPFRQLILTDSSRPDLLEQALADGMVPMRREGMSKVKDGVSTPYEVMRVLYTLE
ncbi:MAG: GspE/PulE family protein [Chloroflexi bacterium]|nr:GspE/PulE family protein [Chloroflexota bacterium]